MTNGTQVIGPLEKLKNSIGGMFLGIILLPAAFWVGWQASHREQASEVLQGALPVEQAAKAEADKKAVWATGQIQAEPLGEKYIKPGPYLRLSHSGQIYAWEKKTKTEKQGNTDVKKTYCEKGWTSNPALDLASVESYDNSCRNASENIARTIQDDAVTQDFSLKTASAAYAVGNTVEFYGLPGVTIKQDNLNPETPLTENDGYFYPRSDCATSPTVGCERISFSGTSYDPASTYCVVGTPKGNSFAPYQGPENSYLIVGPTDYTTTMKKVSDSDKMGTIIWFAASVLCFWLGLVLLTGPIIQLIEFIPFIGGFGAGAIRFVFLIVSFVIMGLFFLLVEYWYIVLLLIAAGVGALIFLKKKKGAPAAAT